MRARWIVPLALLLPAAGAHADDLKRRLQSQSSGATDLQRLDEHRAMEQEIALLRAWLDEAFTELAREEEDMVRLLLDRCDAQAVRIREGTEAAKLSHEADRAEGAVRASRSKVEKTRKDLEQAQVKKKALELNLK
jgi:hypothetical protein